jgi:2-polyprenyl-3-methyl-5-hydroxy-6-metoxy-1,4-benzoquinol methylase
MNGLYVKGCKCIACGGERIRVNRQDRKYHYTKDGGSRTWHYRLLQCDDCKMGFVDPMPEPDVLSSFYDRSYGSYQVQNEEVGTISRLKRITALLRMHGSVFPRGSSAFLQRGLGWAIEKISGRTVPATLGVPLQYPKDAVILDIGYGSGDWLYSMHLLGYRKLHGYDIDANLAHIERLEKCGIRLFSGAFLQNEYPDHSFDCIRLSHVIEHLVDPLAVLGKCARMLKPGGTIALSHPCFLSWLAVFGFEFALTVQLPTHVYQHTPKSTALLLRKAGFIPRQSKAYGVGHMLADTLNKILGAHGLPRLPNAIFAVLAPFYVVFCRLTRKGDFISAFGQTPS